MKPYLSIVIPSYNPGEKLEFLLTSLKKSNFKNFETIVVDDASIYPISGALRLSKNSGPGVARNAGTKRAKGRVLVFLDCDVTVYPDTLGSIAEKFQKDPDLTALTGVWDKHQNTTAFFPQFKALRDWSYWINERDREGYYYLFSTRIAAIKRDVFNRLGGFNEHFRQMEDVEITYRIARRYAIIFAPDVRVHHEFEGFSPVAKKYFWRSFYWSRLYKARKKFDPVATTVWETMAGLSGVATVALLAFSYQLSAIFLLLHIFLLRKFLWFVFREKGFVFMMKSLITGLVLYCVIFAGALYYRLRE